VGAAQAAKEIFNKIKTQTTVVFSVLASRGVLVLCRIYALPPSSERQFLQVGGSVTYERLIFFQLTDRHRPIPIQSQWRWKITSLRNVGRDEA